MKYSRRAIVKMAPVATLSLIALPALGGIAMADNARNFVAHLTGDQEVQLPPVETLAQGQAIFNVNDDGSAISFKLIVANIENLFVSHIHLAPAGANGSPVVFLYNGGLISGRFDGVLAEGSFTAADLVGPLAGHPLSDLIDAMVNGDTYANVHTTPAHPAGEIRGQIH